MLVRMLLCFVNVWVVAYKFVPLGFLLRERLDVNLMVPVLMMGCGLCPDFISRVPLQIWPCSISHQVVQGIRNSKKSLGTAVQLFSFGVFVSFSYNRKRYQRMLVFVCVLVTFAFLLPVTIYRLALPL